MYWSSKPGRGTPLQTRVEVPHNEQAPDPSKKAALHQEPSHPEEEVEDVADARSAADILWALEQAYRNQELRIRSLEARTHGEDVSAHDYAGEHSDPDALRETNPDTNSARVARHEGEFTQADDNPAPIVAPLPHPPQVVVNINEPVAVTVAEAPSPAPASQQVVVVNYYQPFFAGDQTVTRPTRSSRWPGHSSTTSTWEQRYSGMPSSWVAPGFDVYSK
jgi:hypothetical protein